MSKPIKLSRLSLLPALLLAAACGRPLDPQTTEEALTPCEQLGRTACSVRSDCSVEALACDTLCRNDGFGGCLPCDAFRCVPVACEALTPTQCGARSDCDLQTQACTAFCAPTGNGDCAPCRQAQRCVTIPPATCSSLDVATCQTRPDCRVEGLAARDEGFAPCAPNSPGCTRPVTPHCVDAPPPSCEALDLNTCGQRADCHVEDALCDCVNCGCDVPRCVSGPRPCSALDLSTCSTRRDCRIVFPLSGFDQPAPPPDQDGGQGSPPAPPGICVDAGATACSDLDVNSCFSRPDCELRELTACPACVPGQTCPPCETTLVCDVRQSADACLDLDPTQCVARRDCVLEEVTACPACAPGGNCPPCVSQSICVSRPPVDSCTGLDVAACSARTDCRLEEVGVCPACAPGGNCPPCTTTFVCVEAGPVDPCSELDLATCRITPECVVEGVGACPACAPGSTCPPCTVTEICVSAPPIDRCSLLDLATCRVTPECAVESVGVCPACTPGGNCPPCTTSEVCVSAPSHCYGLDANACVADPACELESWACTADCRDDGDGGCLPCDPPAPSCGPAQGTAVDAGTPRNP